MIELFGVGAHTETGAWLFRRVTAGFETGEVTFVMSSDRAARLGLLDVAAAASIATEGRAWITGLSQYVLDPDDPFPEGFTVGDLW